MSVYPGLRLGHVVASVEKDGSVVCLEDGACFQVYSGFHTAARKWQVDHMINVKANPKNPEHPYKLINIHLNGQIEVIWIEKGE
jgi:hypothetical protein